MLLTDAFNLKFSQSEVDFVIPRFDQDLPLCIDPFLLYKSRDDALRQLHLKLLGIFNSSINLYRQGKDKEMEELINFPEADEIGFGYSEAGTGGSGLGDYLNQMLTDTLAASEPLQERGLRHVEELQLVSIGVAEDRISDIAANVLKQFLIEYTQKQADLWKIPLQSGIPVNHYFDFDEYAWCDNYFDLPLNPLNGKPVLLVPRRMVRLLPWINVKDYAATDYKLFLRASGKRGWSKFPGSGRSKGSRLDKKAIATDTRANIKILDHYINRKESESEKAIPAYVDREDLGLPTKPLAEDFIEKISRLPTGQETSKDYQRLVYEILNYLYEPELTDGAMEVKTIDGTERRDIIYTNEADKSFWQYARQNYGSPIVMFEVKNVKELNLENINQTASYLGARIGMLGFIITRTNPGENIIRKTFSIYNDTPGMPRKTIIILTDNDLSNMLRNKDNGESPNPTQYAQRKYREFRTLVQ